jgi:DNA-directed RNA polymerase subunit RPC12/RpoP
VQSTRRTVLTAALVVLCAGLLWRLACRGEAKTPRPPRLKWTCPKCGKEFDARPAAPGSGEPVVCPECQAAAKRLIHYHCTRCGHEFDLEVEPGQEGAMAQPLTCPKCGDKRILPDALYQKK